MSEMNDTENSAICSAYFGEISYAARVEALLAIVQRIHDNTKTQPKRGHLKRNLMTLLKRLEQVEDALKNVDQAFLLHPVNNEASQPVHACEDSTVPSILAPRRLRAEEEFSRFMELLRLQKLQVERAIEQVVINPKGGAPQREDPLQFGVEGLASIWEAARGRPPSMSFKKNGFGSFASDLLALPNGQFEEQAVRGAVISFITQGKAKRSSGGGAER
jgi:hypothetical protein